MRSRSRTQAIDRPSVPDSASLQAQRCPPKSRSSSRRRPRVRRSAHRCRQHILYARERVRGVADRYFFLRASAWTWRRLTFVFRVLILNCEDGGKQRPWPLWMCVSCAAFFPNAVYCFSSRPSCWFVPLAWRCQCLRMFSCYAFRHSDRVLETAQFSSAVVAVVPEPAVALLPALTLGRRARRLRWGVAWLPVRTKQPFTEPRRSLGPGMVSPSFTVYYALQLWWVVSPRSFSRHATFLDFRLVWLYWALPSAPGPPALTSCTSRHRYKAMYTGKGVVNVPVPDASCRRHVQLSPDRFELRVLHSSASVLLLDRAMRGNCVQCVCLVTGTSSADGPSPHPRIPAENPL